MWLKPEIEFNDIWASELKKMSFRFRLTVKSSLETDFPFNLDQIWPSINWER